MEENDQMIELVDYKRVPIGFEVVIVDGKEETVPLWGGGMFMGKEENWDDEVRFINELQKRLRKLDKNARMLRLQILATSSVITNSFKTSRKSLRELVG